MLNKIYFISKTSGIQTANQSKTVIMRVSMTAADPKSFARFDKSCCSNEIRSIAASTLEFNNSTTSTIISEDINKAFCR